MGSLLNLLSLLHTRVYRTTAQLLVVTNVLKDVLVDHHICNLLSWIGWRDAHIGSIVLCGKCSTNMNEFQPNIL